MELKGGVDSVHQWIDMSRQRVIYYNVLNFDFVSYIQMIFTNM